MKVSVKSFMELLDTGRVREKEVILEDEATAGALMEAMGLERDAEVIILVNQRPSAPETVLKEGDRVVIMPPVSAA